MLMSGYVLSSPPLQKKIELYDRRKEVGYLYTTFFPPRYKFLSPFHLAEGWVWVKFSFVVRKMISKVKIIKKQARFPLCVLSSNRQIRPEKDLVRLLFHRLQLTTVGKTAKPQLYQKVEDRYKVLSELPWSSVIVNADINQGSWPSPVNGNRLEARQEIQAKLYWGPAAATGEQ